VCLDLILFSGTNVNWIMNTSLSSPRCAEDAHGSNMDSSVVLGKAVNILVNLRGAPNSCIAAEQQAPGPGGSINFPSNVQDVSLYWIRVVL
jgi:hypothetical protein